VDWVHGWWTTTRSHGSPWTGDGTDRRVLRRGVTLTGVGPLTTPGRRSLPVGREMESGAWGSCFGPHRASGSGVVAG
jgi:hypothetical protein